MLEKTIEARLGKRLKGAGWLYFKFVSPGNNGVPDRLAVAPDGRVYFIELKTDTGVLSPMQTQQIERLRAHGATVRVIRGSDGADAFLLEVGV